MNTAIKRKVQVWIFSPQGHCLLLKTIASRGAFWQPVTGGVEDEERGDEGWHHAADREAAEETGLHFDGPAQEVGYEFEFQSRWGHRAQERVYLLRATAEAAPTLDPTEHDAYRWVTPEEAATLTAFEGNREGLAAALKKL